jgi:hypothetical protein
MMENPDPHREYLVKRAAPRIERRQIGNLEFDFSRRDVLCVPSYRGRNHFFGAIDCDQVASRESLTNHRRRPAMPASYLEDHVVWANAHLVDDPL